MPLGIIILGVLYVLGGIFGILWGVTAMGLGGLGYITGILFSDTMRQFGGSAFWGGFWGIGGGILQLVVGIGLFLRQRWAYLWAWIAAGVSLIGPLAGLIGGNFNAIFGLIIPGIIFYYLTADKDVKQAFGRK